MKPVLDSARTDIIIPIPKSELLPTSYSPKKRKRKEINPCAFKYFLQPILSIGHLYNSSLFEKRIYKFNLVENLKIIDSFTNADVFHWNLELI